MYMSAALHSASGADAGLLSLREQQQAVPNSADDQRESLVNDGVAHAVRAATPEVGDAMPLCNALRGHFCFGFPSSVRHVMVLEYWQHLLKMTPPPWNAFLGTRVPAKQASQRVDVGGCVWVGIVSRVCPRPHDGVLEWKDAL